MLRLHLIVCCIEVIVPKRELPRSPKATTATGFPASVFCHFQLICALKGSGSDDVVYETIIFESELLSELTRRIRLFHRRRVEHLFRRIFARQGDAALVVAKEHVVIDSIMGDVTRFVSLSPAKRPCRPL